MGNAEGNTVVGKKRPLNEMITAANMSERCSFSKENEESSTCEVYTGNKVSRSPVQDQSPRCTQLKGSVLAVPIHSYKASAVDLSLKKSGKSFDSDENEERNSKSAVDVNPAATLKLKFGIETILNPKSNLTKHEEEMEHSNMNSPREALSPVYSDCQSEPAEQSSSLRNESFLNKEQFVLVSERGNKLIPRDTSPSANSIDSRALNGIRGNFKSTSPMRQHKVLQYHPYSPIKIASERSFSDSSSSLEAHGGRSIRGKSESPNYRPFSQLSPAGTNEKIFMSGDKIPNSCSKASYNLTWKQDLIHSPKKKSMSVSLSPYDTHRPGFAASPSTIKHERRSSDHSLHARAHEEDRNTRRNSESDEVFNESDRSPTIPKDLANAWRQQHLSPRGVSSSASSSPGFLTSPDQLKRNPLSFFSTLNNRSPLQPPTSSPYFNFQTWQALTANYHPALHPFVNPYYGHNAATTAFAMACMKSQLRMSSSGAMIPENFQLANSQLNHPGAMQQPPSDMTGGPRKRKKWSRAVFSLSQRRGLENSFQVTKYVAKPERRSLAEALGLTDAQVKIWFQNRRMKWRQEQKSGNKASVGSEAMSPHSGEENCSQG